MIVLSYKSCNQNFITLLVKDNLYLRHIVYSISNTGADHLITTSKIASAT